MRFFAAPELSAFTYILNGPDRQSNWRSITEMSWLPVANATVADEFNREVEIPHFGMECLTG